MIVHRLCRAPFKALDGEGARLYGGRWNSAGRPAVYTSSTLALAALEYLVHLDPTMLPPDLVALSIDIPNALEIQDADVSALPKDWATMPGSAGCQDIGDAWLASAATPVLRVPAAPVPEEYNFLLNPLHPDAGRLKVVAERRFIYDPRLLG